MTRVYLTGGCSVTETCEGGSQRTRVYPASGFYNVPPHRAVDWLATGLAYNATDDNRVIAFALGEEQPQHVDVAAGESLDGLTPTYQPRPEPAPTPEEIGPTETEEPMVPDSEPAESGGESD